MPMSTLFKKLNLKSQLQIHVLNAPESFDRELGSLRDLKVIRKAIGKIEFAIAFAVTRAELDFLSQKLVAAAENDAVLWIAYPKGTSKKYQCEFNRDSGWSVLAAAGYEPVRQVAIDDDWSALRFRKAENIKSLTRRSATAISAEGRKRARK
jgi:hypothetical protein